LSNFDMMASETEQPLPLAWQRVGEDAGTKKGPSFILCGNWDNL